MAAKSGRISSKGQITLPKEFRRKYHLIEGEEAAMIPTKEGILIKHKRESLRGVLAGKIDTDGFIRDLRKLREEWKL
ncbi:MAG: AbrB/MazE/SpoVT family DNA-binding domain-containing protein [Candidatus Hydrothermarchaeaceae archaeon]